MNTYSSKYNKLELEKYKEIFKKEGCIFSCPQYTYFQAKANGLSASFYESGKFVIQGARTDEILAKYFDIKSDEKSPDFIPYPHIGVDESGKGDFFGHLVIAGVLLDEKSAKYLERLGAKDSKKMTDKKILELESKIKEVAVYDIIAISPKKYNELYLKFKNLNKLLAWGHASVIENILTKSDCKIALCDKFADDSVIKFALKEKGRQINLIQKTKAEEDTAVACASILARADFVKKIANLSRQYEITLPKGAGENVLMTAKKIALKYGRGELINISKTHFKTYNEI